MTTVTVVGSGPSGLHFADALLSEGHSVRLFDVGLQAPEPIAVDTPLEDLKQELDDPVRYFLGPGLEAMVQPDRAAEYYGLPPSKDFVFQGARDLPMDLEGFRPLVSWARGGLAEAWTGGCYPFNDAELEEFPIDYRDLAPHYARVARDIGISGVVDDLAEFIPGHPNLSSPVELDRHSAYLLRRYGGVKDALNRKLGLYVGRSRISVLTEDRGDRKACSYLGRCLWGCPRESLYTPSITLRELLRRSDFHYLPGRRVKRFSFDPEGWIRSITWSPAGSEEEMEDSVEVLALAAGTLSTAQIFLESWHHVKGAAPRLTGLMDNRQVLMPFLTLAQIGRPFEPEAYQYNLLAMGLAQPEADEYVHGLVTTLKTALVHPIIQSFPLDLRTATWAFRQIRAALGIVNVNFHDRRREGCSVGLAPGPSDRRLSIRYEPPPGEEERVHSALARFSKGLRRLGAIVPPGMTRWRPMGASVHYSGTLPMSGRPESLTTDRVGRSHDHGNLFIVDGSTFPFLPAKNLTFTLMANARRIAKEAFGSG